MATVINGTNLVLKINDSALTFDAVTSEDPPNADIATPAGAFAAGDVIAAATSCTVNISIDVGEVTDKQSNDRKEFIGLSTSWTMDSEVFYNEDGGVDFYTLFQRAYGEGSNASQNGVTGYPSPVYVQFDSGSDEYTGYAYISSLSATGGTEDAATYSVSLQGTGNLTKS